MFWQLFYRIKHYILNFFLSLLLVIIAHYAIDWYKQIINDKAKFNWELLAEQTALFISNNHTIESLVEKMATKMMSKIQQHLKDIDQLTVNSIVRAYKKSFPKSFRSDKWLFYAYKYIESSAKLIPLQSTFFAKEKNSFIARVFSKITNVYNKNILDSKTLSQLQREVRTLFGEDADARIITFERKGTIIPIFWNNKLAYLFWDTISNDDKILGSIILIIPKNSIKISPIKYGLDNIYRKYNKKIIPVLFPLRSNETSMKIILPKMVDKTTIKRIIMVLKNKSNSNLLPLKMQEIDEFWVMNSFFSYDFPYKLWIFSYKDDFIKDFHSYKLFLWGIYIFLIIFICIYITFSSKHYISIRFSLSFTCVFLGSIPIAGILGLGMMYFEQLKQSYIQDAIYNAKREIDYLSAQSNKTFTDLSLELREVIREISSKEKIYDLSKNKPKELYNILQKNIYQKLGIENLILAIGMPNKETTILPEYGKFGMSYKPQLDIFAPIIVTAHDIYYDYKFHNYARPKLSETQNMWLEIVRAIGSKESFSMYFDIEESGEYTQVGILGPMFQVSYKFSENEYIKLYFILRIPFEEFVKKFFVIYLSKQNVFSNEKNSFHLALIKNSKIDLLFPHKKHKIWQTLEGKKIKAIINSCYHTFSEIVLLGKDKIYVASYKSEFLPYIINIVVDISDKMKEINIKKFLLVLFAIFCGLVVYIISNIISKNIVNPIQEIEKNLQKVTLGDLSVQIEWNRYDEIGELAQSVNGMIAGLRERKALGYFVSKSLEKNIVSELEKSFFLSTPRTIEGVLLVSDIRNFTAISERFAPEVVVSMLNKHFDQMCEAIDNNGGYLEQFIGDAIIAFFPGELEKSAYMAIKASLEMRNRHKKIQEEAIQNGSISYEIGIGLAYGKFMIGSMKGIDREYFALLGESREIAETLESLSKVAKYTKIIATNSIKKITENTYMWLDVSYNNIKAWELVKEI